MKRGTLFLFLFSFVSGQVQAADTYVRKQIKPNFFVPEQIVSPQEKLPMPQYTKGQEETIKAVKPQAARRMTTDNTEENTVSIDDVMLSSRRHGVDYQQKYDDYINDLKQISSTGKIPENKDLQADLEKMTTDDRFVIKTKPHQSYDFHNDRFDRALYTVLSSD